MLYGIVSDVHGNLEALTAALRYLRDEGVEEFVFLGDAVGYGANPNEVCDLLRPLAPMAVLGNHDAAVSGRMPYGDYYEAARHALDWCAAQLSPANAKWLAELPFKVENKSFAISHGAPWAPTLFDYLFVAEQLVDFLDRFDELPPVTFIGHSHLPLSFKLEPSRVTAMLVSDVVCEKDAKYIITAGSVGQPRDRDPRSCCGIFDSDKGFFSYHRLDYDNRRARQKIIDAGLAPMFGERLLVGM